MPPQMMPQGQPQQNPVNPAPQGGGGGVPVQKIIQVLSEILKQVADPQGFVDIQKVIQMWPQFAQQAGLNIPFEVVMQLLQKSPEMFAQLFQQLGLNGIIVNGRRISAQEMMGMASGANSGRI